MIVRYLSLLLGLAATSAATAQTFISTLELGGGNIILQATGAVAGSTGGGVASADRRTLYYFQPDFGDPAPNTYDYVGTAWPYVYVDGSFDVGTGITAQVSTLNDGIGDYLLIGGNPVYQFINDTFADAAFGNFGPWFFIEPDGAATQSTVLAVVPEPSALALLLGLASAGALLTRRRRQA